MSNRFLPYFAIERPTTQTALPKPAFATGRGGIRTRTSFRTGDFKSPASAIPPLARPFNCRVSCTSSHREGRPMAKYGKNRPIIMQNSEACSPPPASPSRRCPCSASASFAPSNDPRVAARSVSASSLHCVFSDVDPCLIHVSALRTVATHPCRQSSGCSSATNRVTSSGRHLNARPTLQPRSFLNR